MLQSASNAVHMHSRKCECTCELVSDIAQFGSVCARTYVCVCVFLRAFGLDTDGDQQAKVIVPRTITPKQFGRIKTAFWIDLGDV